jgi:hypothetical protein
MKGIIDANTYPTTNVQLEHCLASTEDLYHCGSFSVFLAAQQGIHAFTNTFDSTKLMATGELLKVLSAAAMGVAFGAIQGTLRAVQILLVIWAGPSIWGYLGPILATAAAMANAAAAAVVRTVRGIFRKEPTSN